MVYRYNLISFFDKLCILYLSQDRLNSLLEHTQSARFRDDVEVLYCKLARLVGTVNKAHLTNIVDSTCLRFCKNYEVYKIATPIG